MLQDDLNHIGQGLLRMAEQAMSTGIHHLLAAAVAVMQLWAESRLPDRASELNMPGLTDHTQLVVSAVCLAVKMRVCFMLSRFQGHKHLLPLFTVLTRSGISYMLAAAAASACPALAL